MKSRPGSDCAPRVTVHRKDLKNGILPPEADRRRVVSSVVRPPLSVGSPESAAGGTVNGERSTVNGYGGTSWR